MISGSFRGIYQTMLLKALHAPADFAPDPVIQRVVFLFLKLVQLLPQSVELGVLLNELPHQGAFLCVNPSVDAANITAQIDDRFL